MTKMAWKKDFFSGTKQLITLKLGTMQQRVLKYYQICSNDDLGLTMTYFMARSNLVPYVFVSENGKTMEFLENVVVYDIKVGKCSQMSTWSFMNIKGQVHLLTFIQGH